MLSALDSIAWTFNVRGQDVDHTPVALSFALVNADGTADLFVADGEDRATRSASISATASASTSAAMFEPRSAALAGKTVVADPERAVAAIFEALERRRREDRRAARSRGAAQGDQESAEIAGHKAAQARDGAALTRFLHWLSVEAPKGGLDELKAADEAARLPPQGRRPARSQLRHDLGRRARTARSSITA